MNVSIEIRLKAGVLDPQGKAVEGALAGLGFDGVSGVRVGKLIEFNLQDTAEPVAREAVTAMCDTLLANTVVESYTIRFPKA
jgi:phosphoribosylformylglycinamidine synthase subunit PurS